MKKRLTAVATVIALLIGTIPAMAENDELQATELEQIEQITDVVSEDIEEVDETNEFEEENESEADNEIDETEEQIGYTEFVTEEVKAALGAKVGIVESVFPINNSKDVSVLSDIEITLKAGAQIDEEQIAVSGDGIPKYEITIEDENVSIVFSKEMPYKTEIEVAVGDESFSFETERNPITTLFVEDFSSLSALNRFENVGATPLNLYEIYDGKLLMKTHESRLANGGSPVLRDSKNNDILFIKDSENWDEYVVDLDVACGWYTREQEKAQKNLDCEAMVSVNTNKKDGSGMLLLQSYAGGWRACWSYHLNDWVVGGTLNSSIKFKTEYETVHHMRIDASTTDFKADLTNNLDGTLSQTVGWGNGAHPSGGVSLRSSWGRIVFDNLEVTDKGFLFTPEKIKNVKGKLILNFSDTVDEATLSGIKVFAGDKEQAAEINLADDKKSVQISVENLNAGQVYDLSVENVKAASGKTMNSKKELQFTVSDDFDLVKITPAENEKVVDVLSDVKLEFSQKLDIENIEEYISADNMTEDDYIVKADEKVLTVVFKNALPYDSDITVNLKEGIKSQTGKVLETGATRTFHTDEDKSNVLYEQDFEDVSINREDGKYNGEKFAGLTVDEVNNIEKDYYNSFRTENGALLMSLTWKIGQDKDNGHLRFIIDGSENWTDYEISADFMQNVPDVEKWVRGGFGLKYNGKDSGNSTQVAVDWYEVPKNMYFSQLSRIYYNSEGKTDNAHLNENKCYFEDGQWYKLTTEVKGKTVSSKIEKDGKIVQQATDTAKDLNDKGYAYIYPGWYRCYVDNIKVIDKGLNFIPSTTKFTDGTMTLSFDEEMNTQATPIVIFKDESGNEYPAETVWKDNKTISVIAKGVKNNTKYTVTLKKDGIETVSGKALVADKSCRVITDLIYLIENVNITSTEGAKSVTAQLNITDFAKSEDNSYMLVLAVFDESGALYSINTETKKNLKKNQTELFKVTSKELPDDATGYRTECYVWDNMQNINHIETLKKD